MTNTSKIMALAGVLSVVGLAVVPIATYAANTATTTVQVVIDDECGVTASYGNVTIAGLSPATPAGEQQASSNILINCNDKDGWTLSEQINTGKTVNLVHTDGTNSIGPWTAGATPTDFAAKTWGAKYSGTKVMTAAQAYHAIPANGSPSVIAQDTAVASNEALTPTFGAKIDASLPAGTYSTEVLYTVSGR
jgi:hypothetical protein